MTKLKQIADALAEKTGMTKSKSLEAVNALFVGSDSILQGEILAGRNVRVPGFGVFRVIKTKARQGRMRGVDWTKPAGRTVRFAPAKVVDETLAKNAA